MRYEIIWHDCEDDRSGEPFTVEAGSLQEAYRSAVEEIKGFSEYLRDHFVCIDLEAIVDENGRLHNPDYFLGGGKNE
jgi:hypothetical protein